LQAKSNNLTPFYLKNVMLIQKGWTSMAGLRSNLFTTWAIIPYQNPSRFSRFWI